MEKEVVLQVRDLELWFKHDYGANKILNKVSYDIYKGETLGIVGESGCGKSVTSLSIMRLLQISKNLPEMLDCMSIAGGVGIAVGRLASMFNASDRGQIVADKWGLPFAYPVTNAVSGVAENRLATFMLQSLSTAAIVALLALCVLLCLMFRKKLRDGDKFEFAGQKFVIVHEAE